MLYFLNLLVTDWSIQASIRMGRAPHVGLAANAMIKPDNANQLFVLGSTEAFAGSVFVHVCAEYVRPEQMMLDGLPLGRLVSDSLMEKEPKLLGTISFRPSCASPDFEDNDEYLECSLYVGSEIYSELLHRHRSGAELPSEMRLQLEGLSADAPQDAAGWDINRFPELPIVDVRMTMRALRANK